MSQNVMCWCLASSAKMGLVETRLAIIPGAGRYRWATGCYTK